MSLASLFAMTIALYAVLHFWIGLRALWPPPMGGLNAIGTAKRWVVSSPNFQVGSAASSFGVAQRISVHSKGAKCMIRLIF
jgi:hypothetical protein